MYSTIILTTIFFVTAVIFDIKGQDNWLLQFMAASSYIGFGICIKELKDVR